MVAKDNKEMNQFLSGKTSIDDLNAKITSEIYSAATVNPEVKVEKELVFKKYEDCMHSGMRIDVVFDACDVDGTFTVYDRGVLIVLPGEDVAAVRGDVDVHATATMLGIKLSLNVVSVDRENQKVVCEIPSSAKRQVKNVIKDSLQKQISTSIRNEKRPLVWGKIMRVEPRRVLVDILGQGILGIIDRAHWQKSYTRSLMGMCEIGDYLQFEIIKQAPKFAGKDDAWILSRKDITEDAWDKIDYESLKPGGNILVKCIEKPVGKSYWWGVSDRTPGIEIMGDYTPKFSPTKNMLEGITYKCKIKDVCINKGGDARNLFTVIPFGVAQDDVTKVEAVNRLKKIKNSFVDAE